jgi:hypothetical protein
MSCSECTRHGLNCDEVLCSTASDLVAGLQAQHAASLEKLRKESAAHLRQVSRMTVERKELKTTIAQLRMTVTRANAMLELLAAAHRYCMDGNRADMETDIASTIDKLRAAERSAGLQ